MASKKYTKQKLIEILQNHFKQTGTIPTCNGKGLPVSSIYRRYFGSWSQALKAAGFDKTFTEHRTEEITERNASTTKKCSKCKSVQDSDQFPVTKQLICKSCHTKYRSDWYQANKLQHKEQSVTRNKRKRLAFNEWKKTLKCEHCDETFHKCLHFHHTMGEDKEYVIAVSRGTIGLDKLITELGKCGVVCGNCHVKVHEGMLAQPKKLGKRKLAELRKLLE